RRPSSTPRSASLRPTSPRGLSAEELSPKKLIAHLALVSMKLLDAEYDFEAMRKANRALRLRKPSWRGMPDSTVSLRRIRVEKRSPERKKPRYSEERRTWKAITNVEGGDVYPE
ncbi:MAG: hypothetical protein ACUVYA_20045, partial [Planctomycetota bacterium]